MFWPQLLRVELSQPPYGGQLWARKSRATFWSQSLLKFISNHLN